MVEPVYERINYTRCVTNLKDQVKVEMKTEIPSTAVVSALTVSTWIAPFDDKIKDGQVSYESKAVFYLSFVDESGDVKKHECITPFNGLSKDSSITDACKSKTTAVVEKTEIDTAGAYLCLTAYLSVYTQVCLADNVNALVSGEQLIVNSGEMDFVKSFGEKRGVYPVEEEFELNYPVKEVLFHSAEAVITAVQSGVGCIIVDGELLLSLVLLQNNDKNDIIRENRVFPFRTEIECEEAMPNMLSVARVTERSFKTDVSVDEGGANSVVAISVNLLFDGEAFITESLPVAIDAFSLKNEVEMQKESLPLTTACEIRSHNQTVRAVAQVSELPVGASVLAVSSEKAFIAGSECKEYCLSVVGTVCATALLRDGDGKVFARKLEIPFEQTFDGAYDCQMQTTVTVKAHSARARVTSLTQMELESELYFTVYPNKTCTKSIIKSVLVAQEKPVNTNAITVYIAREGEDLWSLAKRLNVCPDELIETNKELQFPLTGDERIIIYRGL